MAKVKEVSSYSGSAWGTAVPIGANATNIDMASNPSDYDSSTTETSTAIINTNDVKVISSDTDLTAWGKFNRFRKRVSNAFGTLSGKTLATAYTTASADSKIYSASVLNNYMTNVIGYSGTTAPSEGTVASQLSSLNSNLNSLKVQNGFLQYHHPTTATEWITLEQIFPLPYADTPIISVSQSWSAVSTENFELIEVGSTYFKLRIVVSAIWDYQFFWMAFGFLDS